MWLSDQTFRAVVTSTPLVSIDLVLQNIRGEILLGLRKNRPAQGFWFVPGGRIRKNESLDDAFKRLTQEELGQSFERYQSRLLGVYEHFYRDSLFGEAVVNPDTHYVTLAYQLVLPANVSLSPSVDQHTHYRWWNTAEMSGSADVHDNTRAYLEALR